MGRGESEIQSPQTRRQVRGGKSRLWDPLAAIFEDERHSAAEQREIIIGHSGKRQLLLVSFTERPQAVRILSARPATKQEQKDYEEGIDIRS